MLAAMKHDTPLDTREHPRYNVKTVLYSGAIALQRAQIATASLDARILLQHVLQVSREQLLLGDGMAMTQEQHERYQGMITQRLARRPVSQLVGRREFFGRSFRVTQDTLDPRADSETLIEAVLLAHGDRTQKLRILDLGTGTGCLLLTLLAEYPNAAGTGVDLSPAALAVAKDNAERLGLQQRVAWVQSDWCEKMPQLQANATQGQDGGQIAVAPFDIVISNPPYIPTGDIASLEPEVRCHEPVLALDGGDDGMTCYRDILKPLPGMLSSQGIAVLEIGFGQQQAVSAIALEHGLTVRDVKYDLDGVARCLVVAH
jgi:release factor glutamine methyltransferase